jgi:hypothetical protein
VTARYLVTAMAAAVAGVAMFGSAASLHEIAVADHLAAAWTMPFCLDLLAITTTTAAVLAGQRGVLVHIGPPIAYLTSLGLQVSAAWAYGPRAWAVHTIPLVAAAYLSEVLLRMWAPAEPTTNPAMRPTDLTDEPTPATQTAVFPPAAERPLASDPALGPSVSPAAPPRAARRRSPGAAPLPLDQLVHRATDAAARRGVSPSALGQADLKSELRIGSARVKEVYDALRRPPLELVHDTDG